MAPRGRKTPPTALADRQARVRHVMGIIASGRFVRRNQTHNGLTATEDDLMAEWGLSHDAVSNICGEAHRRMADVDVGDFVRRRISEGMDEVLDLAREQIREGDMKALSGLAACMRLWADLAGAGPAKGVGDEVPTFRVELTTAPAPTAAEEDGAVRAACDPWPVVKGSKREG